MSQISKAIFAALAVTRRSVPCNSPPARISTPNLAGRFQALSDPAGATEINRAAKGDREAMCRARPAPPAPS